jgi:DNA-directed RNA polymerase subunit RPC12/RpoP
MWKCDRCGQELADQVDQCFKCSSQILSKGWIHARKEGIAKRAAEAPRGPLALMVPSFCVVGLASVFLPWCAEGSRGFELAELAVSGDPRTRIAAASILHLMWPPLLFLVWIIHVLRPRAPGLAAVQVWASLFGWVLVLSAWPAGSSPHVGTWATILAFAGLTGSSIHQYFFGPPGSGQA